MYRNVCNIISKLIAASMNLKLILQDCSIHVHYCILCNMCLRSIRWLQLVITGARKGESIRTIYLNSKNATSITFHNRVYNIRTKPTIVINIRNKRVTSICSNKLVRHSKIMVNTITTINISNFMH